CRWTSVRPILPGPPPDDARPNRPPRGSSGMTPPGIQDPGGADPSGPGPRERPPWSRDGHLSGRRWFAREPGERQTPTFIGLAPPAMRSGRRWVVPTRRRFATPTKASHPGDPVRALGSRSRGRYVQGRSLVVRHALIFW